jgi:hypothetical protein
MEAYAMSRQAVSIAMLSVIFATGVVTAQGRLAGQPVRLQPATPVPQRLEPIREGRGAFEPFRSRRNSISVYGIVQNHLGELVPRAGTVMVRNLADGAVVREAEVDALAQFSVKGLDPGVYAAELVGPAGSVLATSGAFSAGVGEVIQLAQVIPVAPVSGLLAALGDATSALVSSAASAGVLAVDPGQPVSPPAQ